MQIYSNNFEEVLSSSSQTLISENEHPHFIILLAVAVSSKVLISIFWDGVIMMGSFIHVVHWMDWWLISIKVRIKWPNSNLWTSSHWRSRTTKVVSIDSLRFETYYARGTVNAHPLASIPHSAFTRLKDFFRVVSKPLSMRNPKVVVNCEFDFWVVY